MTDIRAAAINCEVKKLAYRQTKDGMVISLLVHPNDMPDSLATAPLGTRYMAALVELGDDEQPVNRNPGAEPVQPQAVSAEAAPTMKGVSSDSCSPKPHQADNPSPSGGGRRWDDYSPAQQAGILCSKPTFQRFLSEMHGSLGVSELEAADQVRIHCGVRSRKDILPQTNEAYRWRELVGDYRAWLAYSGAVE